MVVCGHGPSRGRRSPASATPPRLPEVGVSRETAHLGRGVDKPVSTPGLVHARGAGWTSKRVNSLCRYSSTQCARLTLPLGVMGIEPGATRTRSATLRSCDVDIADVTSR